MTRSKDKGTRAESQVVTYLQAHGFPHAERRALTGNHDKGDIAGIIANVIEVKDVSRDGLPGWIDEMVVERNNANARWGVVWHKRRGKGDPGQWFATMPAAQWVEILRLLGYGEAVQK